MKKFAVAAIAVLLIAAVGIWYFASPYMALSGLRDAAAEGDSVAVMRYVDVEAVKVSLKDQLRERFAAEMSDSDDQPGGAFGAAFGMALVDPMIDAMVTEQNIAAMVENQAAGQAAAGALASATGVAGEAPPPAEPPEMKVERTSFNEFRVSPADGSQGGALIFRRDGLGWQLSGMDIPDDTLGR